SPLGPCGPTCSFCTPASSLFSFSAVIRSPSVHVVGVYAIMCPSFCQLWLYLLPPRRRGLFPRPGVLTPRRSVHSKRVWLGRIGVEGARGVRDLPSERHDGTQGRHIVLHQVVQDGVSGGVLNNSGIENL